MKFFSKRTISGHDMIGNLGSPDGRTPAFLTASAARLLDDGSAGFELYPHTPPTLSLRAALRDAIFLHAAGTCVEADGHWRMLAHMPLQAAGFAEEEALLPAAPPEHGAYLLLSEYFAFPEKFEFIGIDLAALTAAAPEGSTELPLRLLRDVRHDTPEARILHTLGADNLLLGCTPIVNLFPQPATPIRITHTCSSYPLLVDEMPGHSCDIYSIDSVQIVRKTDEGSSVIEFFPWYSLRHGATDSRKGHYWLMQREDLMSAGHEQTFTLVDRDLTPDAGRPVGAGRHVASLRAAGHYR